MRVLKFGGSSVASTERIALVTDIILDAVKEEPIIVVVSAFQGISSQLIAAAKMAADGDSNYANTFKEISKRHYDIIKQLLPDDYATTLMTTNQLLSELDEILQGIALLKELTLGALDHIASFGERLSANIIAAYINKRYPAEYVDARQFIFTDNNHTHANVLFEPTNAAIKKYYDEQQSRHPIIAVVTGFIGTSESGRTTTLGRNSSDYTATILGAALDANRVEIWTDVDGVYSADPNAVPAAFIVPQLTFNEAIELSYFGAKVLHPSTFIPVITKEIPILIKNTLNPSAPGTLITNQERSSSDKKFVAKSITAIDDITLLIWRGHGEIDISGTIERLFKALAIAHVNIFLILEGSPKHTICLAISHHELAQARLAIQHEFNLELQHQFISITEQTSQSIIAIIGDEMKMLAPDIASKMFQALGRVDININAILQGASERNVCLVIDSHQRTRALNLIHQSFFSEYQSLSLVLIGSGRIGSALLTQIQNQASALLQKKIKLSICAIANSRQMLINPSGIDLNTWQSQLAQSNEKFDVTKLLKMLSQLDSSNAAVIDCTASDAIVATYPLFIQEGIHIITPNKRANVLPTPAWNKLMQQFKRHHCYFLCRTNVGAGLPILTVLDDLLACGDSIIKIEGIISGTLSYLFNHYDGTTSFSDTLKQAQNLAMTEPDPREDLSGIDVARKLLILGRRMGWKMDLEDVQVQNLVPTELRSQPYTDQFFVEFKQYESIFKERLLKAKADNKVLRYIGTLKNNKATAELQEIPQDHPLALAVHSDNIISFTTQHYHEIPLVIRGPGAGVECTALGVFSDILKLLSNLPAV